MGIDLKGKRTRQDSDILIIIKFYQYSKIPSFQYSISFIGLEDRR